MSTADTLQALDGEPEIPALNPRHTASSHKQVIAVSVLALSLVGVLGFAATRWFGKKEAPTQAPGDVASATVARVRFTDPAPLPATATAAASPAATQPAAPLRGTGPDDSPRIPSIEPDASSAVKPIAVRASSQNLAPRPVLSAVPTVPVGDESPFESGGDSSGSTATSSHASSQQMAPAGMVGDAQANMRRYQSQLGGMLGQLQSLTNKATGGDRPASAMGVTAPLTSSLSVPSPDNLRHPALFGALERSATPTVAAGLMGNRSLTMPKGVLFTCSLKTRVISATSGFVACQVQRNVFSDDGKVVLAERGSHLDGEYRVVQVRPGVTRIPVLWTRLRTPNGVTVDLDSPGTGALGESGIGGYVDNRWPERIGAAMLVSLIDDAVKLVASDVASGSGGAGSSTVLLPSTTAAGSKLAEKVLEATINIPPLLYQNQGSVVGVYVARDVDFSKVYALEPR